MAIGLSQSSGFVSHLFFEECFFFFFLGIIYFELTDYMYIHINGVLIVFFFIQVKVSNKLIKSIK